MVVVSGFLFCDAIGGFLVVFFVVIDTLVSFFPVFFVVDDVGGAFAVVVAFVVLDLIVVLIVGLAVVV